MILEKKQKTFSPPVTFDDTGGSRKSLALMIQSQTQVETAQLLCNVHHRAREKTSNCEAPYVPRQRIPYKEPSGG